MLTVAWYLDIIGIIHVYACWIGVLTVAWCLGSVSGRGMIGGTVSEASDWIADTSIACRSSAGYSVGHSAVVTSGAQVGSVCTATTYDGSTISSLQNANRVSTGSLSVTVHGANMGTVRYCHMCR